MRLVFFYVIVLSLIFCFNSTFAYALFPDECRPQGGSCFFNGCPSGYSFDYTYVCPQLRQSCCMKISLPPDLCNYSRAGILNPAGCFCSDKTGCLPGLVCGWPGPNPYCYAPSGGGGVPRYTITGHVFGDYNGDDIQNQTAGFPPDPNLGGVTLTLGGRSSGTTTTDANGNYSFGNLVGGNYTVTITLPPGYVNRSTVQYQINLNANKGGYNFGIINVYNISGNVFNDVNKNRIKDSTNGVAETNITSGITITSTGGNLSVNSGAGTYTISNLLAGTYTVRYTSAIPAGYFLIYPLNGPPPQHLITVGPNCNQTVNLSFGSTCSVGSVLNANFAISNSIPWMQSYGFNMRLDEGFEDKIPTNPIYPPYASVSDQINAF